MENASLKHKVYLLPLNNQEITHSVNIKLAVTEENLDYLLRQEYTLSQMCFKADTLTLDTLKCTKNILLLKHPDKNVKETKIDISDRQMDVEDSACSQYSVDQNKSTDMQLSTTYPVRELVNVDISNKEFISLQGFCEVIVKERINEIKKKIIDHKFKKRNKNVPMGTLARKEPEDKKIILAKNPIVFKTLNLINISRALKNHKTFYLNCNINNIIRVKHSLQTFNGLNLFDPDIPRKLKEITLPYSINTSMYQGLISLIQSLLLKEHVDINKAVENRDLDRSNVVKIREINDSPERDLALISPQNTNFLNVDAVNIDTPTLDIILSTAFESPGHLSTNKITKLKECGQYTNSVSYIEVVPAKSNLKRKITAQANNKKNKLQKSGLKFTNVTTFYFERSQGFCSVPTKGGSTLGMAHRHFYISTVPLDAYEHKRMANEVPKRKTNNIFYRKTETREKPKSVQALSLSQRIELLETASVQIELKEEDDCAYIRSSRASAGCDCKDYCDPDICSCNLAGIECQVDRPNFPCGCSKENCRNLMGRNEYNHSKVRSHFNKTIRKLKLERKGRISKRKQASPSKIYMKNVDNEIDIDMTEV